MADVSIDPDGVIALSRAAMVTAGDLDHGSAALQHVIDGVSHLAPGAPDVRTRCMAAAGNLVEQAGAAQRRAVDYVDHEKPLHDLLGPGFWLPAAGNVWGSADPWWKDAQRIATSDEVGAGFFGTSAEFMNRYGKGWSVDVPGSGAPLPFVARLDALAPPAVTWHGDGYVRGPGGLLVPSGSPGVDPRVPPPPSLRDLPEDWGRQGGLRATPVNPPKWATSGSRALGVAGAALTVYGAGYSQWESDQKYHPDMGDGERVARAAGNAAVEGGFAAAGGYAGAVAGAEFGAAVGSIFPGPGTVVGGVVGGVIGGFAGSKVGAATGRGIKSVATKVWKGLFG